MPWRPKPARLHPLWPRRSTCAARGESRGSCLTDSVLCHQPSVTVSNVSATVKQILFYGGKSDRTLQPRHPWDVPSGSGTGLPWPGRLAQSHILNHAPFPWTLGGPWVPRRQEPHWPSTRAQCLLPRGRRDPLPTPHRLHPRGHAATSSGFCPLRTSTQTPSGSQRWSLQFHGHQSNSCRRQEAEH